MLMVCWFLQLILSMWPGPASVSLTNAGYPVTSAFNVRSGLPLTLPQNRGVLLMRPIPSRVP